VNGSEEMERHNLNLGLATLCVGGGQGYGGGESIGSQEGLIAKLC